MIKKWFYGIAMLGTAAGTVYLAIIQSPAAIGLGLLTVTLAIFLGCVED